MCVAPKGVQGKSSHTLSMSPTTQGMVSHLPMVDAYT